MLSRKESDEYRPSSGQSAYSRPRADAGDFRYTLPASKNMKDRNDTIERTDFERTAGFPSSRRLEAAKLMNAKGSSCSTMQ